ncbi:PLP-dependent cysteine synthase family protein [Pseudomonas lijiangensis]|uniref:L-cysteine desulfhydrase Cds1 n=1 Tax=Pseudomonas lijiangensis TaxID=2995658 RepID=A0ABX8HN85_9PSED|nr:MULTISPECIES: PLP-dependent cysteine synthase family protein [Pseudomonas syringae group]MBX8491598.1 PLP-dependent cysteine synthase family protein [Pseudomonas cichorii]MBX8500623.1 PLP-dependent cysteine synthase family protein [Pseudomonas lijiangensis]MBX8504425.1 PLP-dependent cysteine synthase family protein [Pseudomonas lijiangensis]MBX8519563.1 PLP-dependent cysteine synthase family protein [Pseudomonas cichorii]MBX8564292.1 PLP-dependent cysteine synthase family protein [Pseudomon
MIDNRPWSREAIRIIEADFQRSADTHLIPLPLPGLPGVELYFKDESSHPTGSLKHRLARSLFLYALCNGWLKAGAPVIEASSGSTAISEAYFARLLGLPFVAVMPASTSRAKIEQIAFYGGKSHLVQDPTQIYAESERLARETGGHFMDQFTYAERATDWRANNNIAESIYQQLRFEKHPEPTWLISSPGTGGTTATLGRYVRYRQHATRVLCADAERSVFFDYYRSGDASLRLECGSRIEGIGRPRVEASFLPNVIDAMVKVPDALSLAAMHYLAGRLGRKVGGSSGTNLIGALLAARQMVDAGEEGSIVAILCDGGERYASTYYDEAWLKAQGYELGGLIEGIAACAEQGKALPDGVLRAGL